MELLMGKSVTYPETYSPQILYKIPRKQGRETFLQSDTLPFDGLDVWNGYELSWLDDRRVPHVGMAVIEYAADSLYLVESKSLKLYLGSLFNHSFSSVGALAETISKDLSSLLESPVEVLIRSIHDIALSSVSEPPGVCIEEHFTNDTAAVTQHLTAGDERTRETIHSNLLRSLCPVTAQPDWATVIVGYEGKKLDHDSLCRYLIAHRTYQGFHEECCERIFVDLMNVLEPTDLCVVCCYTRRGGIDINPMRWMKGKTPLIGYRRLVRQ